MDLGGKALLEERGNFGKIIFDMGVFHSQVLILFSEIRVLQGLYSYLIQS